MKQPIPFKVGRFYVYVQYRDAAMRTPFYVGKGKDRRWEYHEWRAASTKHRSHHLNIIRQFQREGLPVPKRKVKTGLTEQQAFDLEVMLIAKYGIERDGGLLVNESYGGDGGTTGYVHTRKSRKKIGAASKVNHANPATKAKHAASSRAAHARPDVKEKHRAATKAALARPEVKKRHMAGSKAVMSSAKMRIRTGRASRISWARPEVKAKRRATDALPETKRRRSEASRTALAQPGARKKQHDGLVKWWARRRGKNKERRDERPQGMPAGQRHLCGVSQRDSYIYKCSNGFLFEVPTSETGDATFQATERAMLLMNWIKAGIAYIAKQGGELNG